MDPAVTSVREDEAVPLGHFLLRDIRRDACGDRSVRRRLFDGNDSSSNRVGPTSGFPSGIRLAKGTGPGTEKGPRIRNNIRSSWNVVHHAAQKVAK